MSADPPSVVNADGVEEPQTLVLASRITKNADGDVVDSQVSGDLTLEQRDRVARPYTYLHETTLYATEIWFRSDDGITVERGYNVWSQENPQPTDENPPDGPIEIPQRVLDALEEFQPDELMQLDLEIRDFPEWNVPLRPDVTALSPADVALAMGLRNDALVAREQLFANLSAALATDVLELGGEVITRWWKPGWLSVRVPRSAFDAIEARPDIARIDGPYGVESGPTTTWLNNARGLTHLDAQAYLGQGFDGEHSNASRHSYGDITVGVTEPDGFESGACAFRDGVGCGSTSRVRSTSRCDDADNDGNWCEPGTVDTNTSDDAHGTLTASIIMGDYMGGQGNGQALGDSSWTNNTCTLGFGCGSGICESGLCAHSSSWESQRTGMAPEASAVLFGRTDPANQSLGYTDMLDDSIDLGLDIVNASWLSGDQNCDMKADRTSDQEAEIAFDDGILVVGAAGNDSGHIATSCTVRDPADTPKVLVVNAYDIDTTNCAIHPSTRCLLDRDNCPGGTGCAARGGATANVAGVGSISGAVSLVDLVAPNNISGGTTSTNGTLGLPNFTYSGTSAAAPHVSGLAVLVKDWLIDEGEMWINSPGYLHTMMLAMGDRHRSTNPASATTWTSQITATPNQWYGLGRARMRLFEPSAGGVDPVAFSVTSYTRTTPGSVTYFPFGIGGMPSGVELIKCTSFQIEDMSGSNTQVSEFKLRVEVRPNASPFPCTGTPSYTRTSNNCDLKKVAALQGSSYTNRCVAVNLEWENVSPRGLTVQTACYFTGVADDEL